MKYFTNQLVLVLLISIFAVACDFKKETYEKPDLSHSSIDTTAFFSKIEKMKKSLEGKKIAGYDLLLDTTYSNLTDTHLILYFTGGDCSSCIQKAIEAIDHKNMINDQLSVVPISYQANIGRTQLASNVSKYLICFF